MRRSVVLLLPLLLVLPSACAQPGAAIADPAASDPARDHERQVEQAHAALDRWAAAGGRPAFVPAGPVSGQLGSFESDVAGPYKDALAAGALELTGELPEGRPAPGEIRWPDGTRHTAGLMTAAEAFDRLRHEGGGTCDGVCRPAVVTGARLATAKVTTSRGEATVPAWEFTVKDSAVLLWRAAVSADAPAPGSHDPDNPPAGLSAERATLHGNTLTAHFIGANGPASQRCGADYTAELVTSDVAVVVLIVEHPFQGPPREGYGCDDVGYPREASADLPQPLGDRVVLEVRYGTAIPVTAA